MFLFQHGQQLEQYVAVLPAATTGCGRGGLVSLHVPPRPSVVVLGLREVVRVLAGHGQLSHEQLRIHPVL